MRKPLIKLRRREDKPKISIKQKINIFSKSKVLFLLKEIFAYPLRRFNSLSNFSIVIIMAVFIVVAMYIISKFTIPTISASSQTVMDLLNDWNSKTSIMTYNTIGLLFINFYIKCARLGDHNPPYLRPR